MARFEMDLHHISEKNTEGMDSMEWLRRFTQALRSSCGAVAGESQLAKLAHTILGQKRSCLFQMVPDPNKNASPVDSFDGLRLRLSGETGSLVVDVEVKRFSASDGTIDYQLSEPSPASTPSP